MGHASKAPHLPKSGKYGPHVKSATFAKVRPPAKTPIQGHCASLNGLPKEKRRLGTLGQELGLAEVEFAFELTEKFVANAALVPELDRQVPFDT